MIAFVPIRPALLLLALAADPGSAGGPAPSPPPAATFSIVAADPETGEIGVAVASKIVGVGAVVPFAEAGTGAVATQSFANTRYGPGGVLGLRLGMAPGACVELLTGDDPRRETRQVAVIDAGGGTAVFTGSECLPWAGSVSGENFAALGNLLAGPEVVEAMAEAFLGSGGTLAERLLAALGAGQEAGGDRRGRQSAALLVVRKGWGYGGLGDRYRDIRVDEHPDPVAELERIHRAHRALFPRPGDPAPSRP